jgi:hypothetical protein
MIVLSGQPISLTTKVSLEVELAQVGIGSQYQATTETPWFGDLLSVQALLPEWILKAYNDDPNNVAMVPLIKNYFRWLFSLEYGYGAQLDWENIRVPLYMNSIFLEALADFYFPGADFSATPLATILPNIRKFAIKADANYFNVKGTPAGIKYLICNLLGFEVEDVYVVTTSYVNMQIQVSSAEYSNLVQYQTFLNEYVIPAGIAVEYKAV